MAVSWCSVVPLFVVTRTVAPYAPPTRTTRSSMSGESIRSPAHSAVTGEQADTSSVTDSAGDDFRVFDIKPRSDVKIDNSISSYGIPFARACRKVNRHPPIVGECRFTRSNKPKFI